MQRVVRPDPNYVRITEWESQFENAPWQKLPKQARDCRHLWQANLPADASTGTHLIHVRTTDMFGNQHAASRVIRITSDPMMPSTGQ